MDPQLTAAITSAASTLMGLAVKDGWQAAKEFLHQYFDEPQAQTLATPLRLAATGVENEEEARQLEDDVAAALTDLATFSPDGAQRVKRLIESLQSETNVTTFTAVSHDQSRIYQQGSGTQWNG